MKYLKLFWFIIVGLSVAGVVYYCSYPIMSALTWFIFMLGGETTNPISILSREGDLILYIRGLARMFGIMLGITLGVVTVKELLEKK